MSYNIYTFDEQQLSFHAAAQFRKLLLDPTVPLDIAEKIEDQILPALDYIEGWEPSDAEIMASNSCGTPWHDGCK